MHREIIRRIGMRVIRLGTRFMEHGDNDIPIFSGAPTRHPAERLMVIMDQVPRTLADCKRWKNYRSIPPEERETVLMHSWSSTLLMMTMLSLEDAHGVGAKLNHPKLIGGATLHDSGEGSTGDVTFVVKNDPRVKEPLKQIEDEQVATMFGDLWPDASSSLMEAFNVQEEDSIDGRFFNAMEVTGYLLYAIPQMRRGRTEFIEVYIRQHERMLKHAEEFASVRLIYEPLRKEVEQALALHERAKKLQEKTRTKSRPRLRTIVREILKAA